MRILVGDVQKRLGALPEESVHCVVTSPPYFGLRDYGTEPLVWGEDPACAHEWGPLERGKRKDMLPADATTSAARSGTTRRQDGAAHDGGRFCRLCGAWRGSLGQEPTPGLYIEHLVEVFREIRRVLRKDGTVWLVIGDSYNSGGGTHGGGKHAYGRKANTNRGCPGLKPKDLVMLPARVALALQADGWWVRSDIIWAKSVSFCGTYSGSCMPESARDRPTMSYEHVFLLSKSRKYFFDMEAVKEPCAESSRKRIGQRTFATQRGGKKDYGKGINPNRSARKALENFARSGGKKRHLRAVWTISTHAFAGAHFAVYPERLVEPCVKAGTSQKGCCPRCGAPWVRVTKKKARRKGKRARGRGTSAKARRGKSRKLDAQPKGAAARRLCANVRRARSSGGEHDNPFPQAEAAGWKPSCMCDAGEPVPCTVLDPFLGSGTTALVALMLGRAAVGVELNPEYAQMARRRLEEAIPLLATATPKSKAGRATGAKPHRRSRGRRCGPRGAVVQMTLPLAGN